MRTAILRLRYFAAFTACAWVALLGRGAHVDEVLDFVASIRVRALPGMRPPR